MQIDIGEDMPQNLKKLPTPFEWIQSKGWFWKLHSCKDIWWACTWHKGMSKQNHTKNNKLL